MSKNFFSHKPNSPGGDVHNIQQGRLALRWGKIVELAPQFSQVRVETDELDEIPTYWLSVLYPKTLHDKYYWMPELDEFVWFLWDEQGEEGVILGAFYCAEVEHDESPPPSPHKTEVAWGDKSFVLYDREEHKLEVEIRGEVKVKGEEVVIEACQSITLKAPVIIIEGAITMAGGMGGIAMTGASFLAGGIPLAGIGSPVSTPAGLGAIAGGITGGLPAVPGVPPICEPPEEVEVELEGDLRRLNGYTPPGYGGA